MYIFEEGIVMGIKMSKVRHDGNELKINDYDIHKKYNQLKCFYCNADVCYVDTYKRNLGDKEITVNHYFRLKKGHKHDDDCKYEVDGAMLDIVAKCADNEIMTKNGNKFKVRLLLMSDKSHDISKLLHIVDGENGHGKKQKNYIPNGKEIAYLSSMKRIMKLRTQVEENSDLGEKVELQFTDKFGNIINIPWNKFYYEASKEKDYGKLLKYLSKKKIYHPICVDGYIRQIKIINNYYILDLEAIKITDSLNGGDERVSVSYFLSHEQIFKSLEGKEGARVVVYAQCNFIESVDWNLSKGKIANGESVKKILYHKITGNVYDEKQILILDI